MIEPMKTTRLWQCIALLLCLFPLSNVYALNISSVFETTEIPTSDDHHHDNHGTKTNKWYFWRTDTEVEVANADRSFGEKWIKSSKNNIFYQVLYHDKKFLINFQPVDLMLLGKKENWENRSELFPPSVLKQLKKQGTDSFKQYQVVNYEGTVSGINYKVAWLPELQLPLRVEKTSPDIKTITELLEIYPLENTPFKRANTEKYEDMDYADIGDNESHPIVSQLQNNSGIGYFHHH